MNYIALDLSDAVPFFRYWDRYRLWCLWLVLTVPVLISLHQRTAAVVLLVVVAGSYLTLRWPNRAWLQVWIWFLMASAIFGAIWSFRNLGGYLGGRIKPSVLLPLGAIVLYAGLCIRISRKGYLRLEDYEGGGWLSGGTRTDILISILFLTCIVAGLYGGQDLFTGYRFLILGVGCCLVIRRGFIPLLRSVRSNITLPLVRAIALRRSAAHWGRFHDTVLELRLKLKRRPIMLLWFPGVALTLSATIGFFVYGLGSGIEINSIWEVNAIPLWALAGLFALCFIKAQNLIRRPLDLEDLGHAREFSLYLRSFSDDRIRVLRDGMVYRVWPFRLLEMVNIFAWIRPFRFLSFEKVLTGSVSRFGTVVSLGRQPTGLEIIQLDDSAAARRSSAWRFELPDDVWQDTIATWIKRAQQVLITAGYSEGLKWEFQELGNQKAWEKMIVVLPPADAPEVADNWGELCACFPHLLACPEAVVGDSVAVRFANGDGLPIFILTIPRSVASYRLALSACWLPVLQLIDVAKLNRSPA